MTATPAPQPTAPTLTPARKRLIRREINRYGTTRGVDSLEWMPSFDCVPRRVIWEWVREMGLFGILPPERRKPASPAVTQATAAPATDPTVTGEWYSALAIARGLDVGVERVYGWRQFGWLQGGPLYTAADIRAFVRAHPLEIRPRYLSDESWLWLVSVLAGSQEQSGMTERE